MAASWESHKDTLRTLYITRDESLRSTMNHMKDAHEFVMKYNIESWFSIEASS